MDKKTTLENEHKAEPVVKPDARTSPDKDHGPHAAQLAEPESGVNQRRKGTNLQREVGNARLGRMFAAQSHANEAAPAAEKHVSPIQLEQEKGRGHV